MGNLAKAYSNAIGRKVSEEELPTDGTNQAIKQQDQELAVQTRMDWLQNPATAEMFRDLKDVENDLITQAIFEAVKNTPTINTQLIVQLLTRVDSLRKIKDTYGRLT